MLRSNTNIPTTTLATPFRAALAYARLGYRVLPLAPGEKRPYSRLVPNGLKDASADPQTLHKWWTQAPDAGVGILPPAQVVVLDFDRLEAWERLTNDHPNLLRAPQQKTPRGGRHVFLRLPDGVEGLSASTATLAGVDVRGLGKAYLAAAPTQLKNGVYRWEVDLVAPDALPLIPDLLLAELLPPPAPPPEFQPQGFRGVTIDQRTQLLEGLLRWAGEQVEGAPEGTRHNTLLRFSRLVGGYVHLGLDPDHAAQVLAEAGVRAGLPRAEAARTAHDGLKYGQKAPLTLPDSRPTGRGAKPGSAQRLIELATTHAELWHDERKRGWATVEVGGHKENWLIHSRHFELWLRRLFFQEEQRALSAQVLSDAQGALEAAAVFTGEQHPVFLRVGHRPGEIWLDLGREAWEVVRVTAAGWEIAAPPIRFRRSAATRPLPVPERGAGGKALRGILEPWELEEAPFALVVAWLLGVLSPGPYPVLALMGEQGAGKSTLARVLQRLVDPTGDLGTLPRDSGELFLAANNSHILAFDNISHLPPWLSDDFCKLSTGGMLRKRQLYTDDEETFFEARNPIILNGISDYLTRQDLIDRSIVLHLEPVGDPQPESELWRGFEKLRARALGDLLDLASLALLHLRDTPTPSTRMADFARWALAAESGYAPPGVFEAAFSEMRGEMFRASLENDPVYPLLLRLLEGGGRFEGSAAELLDKLNGLRGDTPRPPTWPRSPNAMGAWLKRVAPALRQAGIRVEPLPRTRDKRGWVLDRASQQGPTAARQDEERQVVPADQAEQKRHREWKDPWMRLFARAPEIASVVFATRDAAMTIEVDGKVVHHAEAPSLEDLRKWRPDHPEEWWVMKWLAITMKTHPHPKEGIRIYAQDELITEIRVAIEA